MRGAEDPGRRAERHGARGHPSRAYEAGGTDLDRLSSHPSAAVTLEAAVSLTPAGTGAGRSGPHVGIERSECAYS